MPQFSIEGIGSGFGGWSDVPLQQAQEEAQRASAMHNMSQVGQMKQEDSLKNQLGLALQSGNLELAKQILVQLAPQQVATQIFGQSQGGGDQFSIQPVIDPATGLTQLVQVSTKHQGQPATPVTMGGQSIIPG